jgi:hypothetical protein
MEERMTREETKQVLMIIQATYPNYKPPDRTVAVNAWNMALEEYPYKVVEIALKTYIKTDTSGFAPSPGQIIEKIHIADDYTGLSEMEAWTLVSKALRNGIYGADVEFEKLPRAVQKAVVSPDNLRSWAMADTDSVETVIQSNFLRTYRATKKQDAELKKLPGEVQMLIAQTIKEMETENSTLDSLEQQLIGG